jgi:dihydrofolate synthase / folylpolyglutamate synthase
MSNRSPQNADAQVTATSASPSKSARLVVEALQTRIFRAGADLVEFVAEALQGHSVEGKVLAITSKIVSLSEGATVPEGSIAKADLIAKEADTHLGIGGMGVHLTIKHSLLIPSAGIDESNSENGDYILFPKDPYASAKRIHQTLKQRLQLSNFGILITDSCPPPLRRGVIGVSLAHWGFKATRSFVGEKDLFGRELQMTTVNVVDSLAAMAVFAMGEANESAPLALVSGVDLEFTDSSSVDEIAMPAADDLYSPLFKKHQE